MLKVVSDSFDHVMFIVLTWTISMAMFKCSIVDGYRFPFTGLIVAGAPLAIIGIGFFLYKLLKFKPQSITTSAKHLHNPMNLSSAHYLIISGSYAISQILSVTALTYSHLSFLRFVIISIASEAIILPVLSTLILKRELHSNYPLAIIVAIAAICINELTLVDRQTSPTVQSISFSIDDGWEGPLLTFISKFIAVFGSVISKKYIIQEAFKIKLAQPEFNEEPVNESMNGSMIDEITDYTAEVKPQLLSKNSFLYKRFELIKKLDPNFEDLRIEVASRDPYLENKFTEFRKLIGDNTVKVHQIVELPAYQSRPKFQYNNVDYTSLKEEELEEVLNVDDEHQAKTRADIANVAGKEPTNFKDLKRWEVQTILKLESRERNYLEEFLKDYLEMKRTSHLFSGYDDLLLTKYDSIFDSMVYDNENFSTDLLSNIELYGMMNLALCIVGFFAAFINSEFYNEFYQTQDLGTSSSTQYVAVSFLDNGTLAYYLIAAVLFLLKSLVIERLVVNHTSGVYVMLRLLAESLIVLIASTYTNSTPYIRTNALISLVLVGIAQYINFSGMTDRTQQTEFASIVEMIKSFFATVLEPDQVNDIELMELSRITKILNVQQDNGDGDAVDTNLVASNNSRQLLHSANPVLFMRQHYDLFFNRRAHNWGGGCPRPSVESIESAWKSKDRTDVWIDSIDMIRDRYYSEKSQWKTLKKHKANQPTKPKKAVGLTPTGGNSNQNAATVYPMKQD